MLHAVSNGCVLHNLGVQLTDNSKMLPKTKTALLNLIADQTAQYFIMVSPVLELAKKQIPDIAEFLDWSAKQHARLINIKAIKKCACPCCVER